MNTKRNILIILAAVGLALICAGAIMGGSLAAIPATFQAESLPNGAIPLSDVKTSDIQGIQLKLNHSKITIKSGRQFDIAGTGLTDSYVQNGILYAGAGDTKYFIKIFGFKLTVPSSWVCGYANYVLTIPEKNKLQQVTIDTVNSDITGDGFHAGQVAITMKRGSLSLDQLSGDTILAQTSHGTISIPNITTTTKTELTASGTITLGNSDAKTSSLANLTCTCTGQGQINLTSAITGVSALSTEHGDIITHLAGSSAQYRLTSDTGMVSIQSGTQPQTADTTDTASISYHCNGDASADFYAVESN